ncbi:hypothetical protein H8356DRAFT_600968 [Neocallimastix lanati (nom. inval.)]|jgi:hypothetical protein|uniref:Uncharacterized protein n=1 Tax=Neocallimastix californiae TaxID=1754190 RepID=A0A1Y2DFF5_9FUNG|nr:hypothetical protein H8356DRAFT_600968 [Neocallimastix sp. JGI-2020a]ORY57937.1 hypothetical protein LY90DRAFT_669080 [Neocallimastix californiae]|eukprot:ORY57937.1 hypothetical protein LY90DRAFT_669080 [Neocallimastix californiae]
MNKDFCNFNESNIYDSLGKDKVCELIKKNNVNELKSFIEKFDIYLNKYNNNDFDLLIYAIKNNASKEMVNYIIEKTDYKNLDYSIKEKINFFSSPLFIALSLNNFQISDLLLEKGADINAILCNNIDIINEEDVSLYQNPFKYFDMNVNRDCFTRDYSRAINSNVIQYLCETETLCPQNVNYIAKHGFNTNSIRPGIIKQLEKNKKYEYAKLISELINEGDLD